jgi:pimeloyl-ACP methyl ester carboxylesterase
VLARALAVDLRSVLPTVDIATLIVHGRNDVRAPKRVADELLACIPGAEMTVIEGAGHAVNLDAPDRLVGEVRAFLMRHEG